MNRLLAIDAQARLNYFHDADLVVDGIWGPVSQAALEAANRGMGLAVLRSPYDALRRHPSGLIRIIAHWTAGAGEVIALERRHYHLIVGQDARVYHGDLMPEANASTADGVYAAHTRGLNGGSIGIAFDAMVGAVERPFDPGPFPITPAMVDVMAETLADLAETYSIPVTRHTILTHAEVQPTLGVKQRAKWDVTWLPGMKRPGDAVEVGDVLRRRVVAAMA